jgi:hypothetical protein
MHDALFANKSRLSIPTIFLIAEELGLRQPGRGNADAPRRRRRRIADLKELPIGPASSMDDSKTLREIDNGQCCFEVRDLS